MAIMVSMAMIENAAIRLPTRNGLAHCTARDEVNVFAAGPPLQSPATGSTQGSPLVSAAGQMPFRLGDTGRSTGLFLR